MPREFSRSKRLGNEVLRTLNELVRFETKDPSLKMVSLSSLELSRDLSVARVYFSLLDPNGDPAPVQEGLERASGFLRSRLGREVKIRHVPELRFAHDDSAAEAQRISSLIDRALDSDKSNEQR
ncbi:MAG: 30S ribosome-binding factor RbfA [Gammaproteobacteria bacterium]|jgi:ribosome-binding factor A|nr:30S ribosome-binding factor RbfA [Gammaproteobacteria bacterium]MDH5261600.1 30S ribosome-binding factor RbfA [Gammaproteobacteria bacterium]